ncbi:MAG: glycosyl hydrolase 108 family protein, partial [Paracoccaceae bacterium]
MTTVAEIAEEIVAREGGYVNDPDDPGGATNHGVTIGTLRRLGLDVTGDGRIDTTDVRRLTRRQATDIYVEHYFQRPGIAALPEALHATVFDMYVNAGSNAVKILQRL